MLSKNKIKLIKSLEIKKNRLTDGLFVAEGTKLVNELVENNLHITYIAATEAWQQKNTKLKIGKDCEMDIVNEDELKRVSFQKTPQEVICVAKIPKKELLIENFKNKLSILLDKIQDPGNLGTILRIADWFGIENIICSNDTVDAFNPKVVQATMGAICRVNVFYEDLSVLMPKLKQMGIPIYGAALNGKNIYTTQISTNGFIMMGNESKGINPAWECYLDEQILIPFYPVGNKRSESLNVAVATAIICSEFRRKLF